MTKQILQWSGLVIIMYILQTTVTPVLAVFGVKPDFLVLVLFFLAIKTDAVPAVFAGFFLGLTQDFYSPVILGQNALSKTVSGFFIGLFNEKVMRIDPVFQLALLFLMFVLHDVIYFSVQIAITDATFPSIGMELLTLTIPRALYTLVFALIPVVREYFFSSGFRR